MRLRHTAIFARNAGIQAISRRCRSVACQLGTQHRSSCPCSYWPTNLFRINSQFGTAEELRSVLEELAVKGVWNILDGEEGAQLVCGR